MSMFITNCSTILLLVLCTDSILDITCDALPEVDYGHYTEAACTTQERDFGEICSLECDLGYVVDGDAVKSCQIDGTWNSSNGCIGEICITTTSCPWNVGWSGVSVNMLTSRIISNGIVQNSSSQNVKCNCPLRGALRLLGASNVPNLWALRKTKCRVQRLFHAWLS